jgi:8-oxo-dGTP pyrophosphatase MutT (NUDIX family)
MSAATPPDKLRHDWTASVLVLRPDRQILLLLHRKLGVWLGPGGHVDPGEGPDEAALREVMEETGLAVALVGARDPALDDPRHDVACLVQPYVILKERIHDPRDPHFHLDHIYCARLAIPDALAAAALADAPDIRFVAEDELAALPMFDNFRALIARVFADRALWAAIPASPGSGRSQEASHGHADHRS